MQDYPGFQRIFFLIDNEAAHKKKISSGTQGSAGPTWNSVFNSVIGRGVHCPTCVVKDGLGIKRGLLFVNGQKL